MFCHLASIGVKHGQPTSREEQKLQVFKNKELNLITMK